MKLLFFFGTRPEAIKLSPIILEAKNDEAINLKVCVSAQHREMLDDVLSFFKVNVDYDLNIMRHGQSLFSLTSRLLISFEEILNDFQPDAVIVQGDTTSAFVGALSAYYKKIKIIHVEAGLRSYDLLSPFPEEGNRKMITHLANFHFAPTNLAVDHLSNESISNHVYNVGNTVVDSLYKSLAIIKEKEQEFFKTFHSIDFSNKIILLTCHRRENWGLPFENICSAIDEIVANHKDVEVIFPVHLNPLIKDTAERLLAGKKRVHLFEPFQYDELVWIMNKSYMVLTDSGGIQEEAPALGKPVIVLRDTTERQEAIQAGTAVLAGTDIFRVVDFANKLLQNSDYYNSMAKATNPFGDGEASGRILKILKENL